MLVEWNVSARAEPVVLARLEGQLFSAAIIRGESILAAGEMKSRLHILDYDKKKEVRNYLLDHQSVFNIAYYEAANLLLVGTGDGHLLGFHVPDGQLIFKKSISPSSLRCLALHPEKPLMAIGSSDNNVYLSKLPEANIIRQLPGHSNSVFTCCFSPDGQWLASGGRDAHIRIWQMGKNVELYQAIPAHMQTVNRLAFSPDGRWLASASRDKEIRIWDGHNFKLLKVIGKQLEGHQHSVNCLLWDTDRSVLYSAGDDRHIMGWQITAV